MALKIATETIVLIAGANQGLGYECVKKLAAEQTNYRIILAARDVTKGQNAASQINKLEENTTVEAVNLDVTSDTSIAQAVIYVENKYYIY